MKKLTFLLLLLSAIFFIGCKGSKKVSSTKKTNTSKNSVYFENSDTLTEVLDMAAAKDKLVFVDFYTSWCLPCKMMDQDVFTDKKVKAFFDKNFISYKVNAEKGNGVNLATIFEVRAYPTLLFLDDKGRVLQKKEGALYPTGLLEFAQAALDSSSN